MTNWSLRSILAIRDHDAFLNEVVSFGKWRSPQSIEEVRSRPIEKRMINGLRALYLANSSGGIGELLSEQGTEAGLLFYECIDYCERIDATRMAEYLKKVASYFPNGIVPRDDDDRWDALNDLNSRPDCRNFCKERHEYGDAPGEMVECLRQYIWAHFDTFEKVLSTPPKGSRQFEDRWGN